MLPRDTIRIAKRGDQARLDFSSFHRIVSGGAPPTPAKVIGEGNPVGGKDYTILIRSKSKDARRPSVVLIDWERQEFVDLVEDQMQ